MADFDRRVIPTFGLSALVLDDHTHQMLRRLITAGRTHKFVSVQWGFGSGANVVRPRGLICLLCGRPGTGKSAIAHAVAYELGQAVKVSYQRYHGDYQLHEVGKQCHVHVCTTAHDNKMLQ